MNDVQAQETLEAVMQLAVTLRDNLDAAPKAAQAVLAAAGGDPVAAICVAAALIKVDEPIDNWWQAGLAGLRPSDKPLTLVPASKGSGRGVREHGSHRGYNQHRTRKEVACNACLVAEREYSAIATARRRARNAS